jgi:hypothetical protein
VVQTLVRQYMKNENTIILAVLPAIENPTNQIIRNMAEKEDPDGNRTMGIITEPDLAAPSGEEDWIRFANKKGEYVFKIGWHVVKNLDTTNAGSTLEERDIQEKLWLQQSAWKNQLKSDQLRIVALHNRLSRLLEAHTRDALPSIISDIENQLEKCQVDLAKFGKPRPTLDSQRKFLQNISVAYTQLADYAIIASYQGPFSPAWMMEESVHFPHLFNHKIATSR